jgi:SagB-type dehydrogenase family enzyme
MPEIGQILFRRSPHLVCFWQDGQFLLQNFATGARINGLPLTCDVLDFFDDWRPAQQLFESKPQIARASLAKLLTALVKHSLLQRADGPFSPKEKAMEQWARWNPVAGFFHTGTKDVPFDDLGTTVRLLKEQARATPMPEPVKRYDKATIVPLLPPDASGEFPSVLLARRTWRRFSDRPLNFSLFSTLLGLTAGIQQWVTARGEGRVALKTSPSGGARHSIEMYVLALRVAGLPRGLYHYASDAHVLELLSRGVNSRRVDQYLPTQWWYRHASAVVLLAAVFPRELWRYAYARAYRAVLIESGHLCQTFCLTATWLGLAPFCSMALADSRVEKDLGLDGITESVVYAAGVGTRPAAVAWRTPKVAPPATVLSRADTAAFPGRIVRPSGRHRA